MFAASPSCAPLFSRICRVCLPASINLQCSLKKPRPSMFSLQRGFCPLSSFSFSQVLRSVHRCHLVFTYGFWLLSFIPQICHGCLSARISLHCSLSRHRPSMFFF